MQAFVLNAIWTYSAVGAEVGLNEVGLKVGVEVGTVGREVGDKVGSVGLAEVGVLVGKSVGLEVGEKVGSLMQLAHLGSRCGSVELYDLFVLQDRLILWYSYATQMPTHRLAHSIVEYILLTTSNSSVSERSCALTPNPWAHAWQLLM